MLAHLHLFPGNEAVADHGIEHRLERIDLFLTVNDFDHEREILPEAEGFRGMQAIGVINAETVRRCSRVGKANSIAELMKESAVSARATENPRPKIEFTFDAKTDRIPDIIKPQF